MEKFKGIETEQIGADLSRVVDRIVRQYESFPVAFQKEAIQNSWDVREDRKEGRDWLIKIYPFEEGDNIHLIVEDFGTKGMNIKRWEAFQSLWRPEKDHADAGGQGQGKFVLMGASNDRILIVESMSDEVPYRCKFLRNEKKSIENSQCSIQDFIPKAQPLNHKGTKVWIYNVKEDFLNKIKSQEFTDSIIESWWQTLGTRFNAAIHLFNQRIQYPRLPQQIQEKTLLENFSVGNLGRIKRLVLGFYEKTVPEVFQGVRIQRSNMMITRVPFEVSDKEYMGRFSGYIEFDESLEKQLKEIEKTDHCGFIYDSPWKELKTIIKDEVAKFAAKIVPSKEQRKPLSLRNLSEVIKKANQIINDYCPEILGGGREVVPPIPQKPKPPLRIKYLNINKKEVKYGDLIKTSCNIINETEQNPKILLYVELKRLGVKISEEKYKLKILAGEQKLIKLSEIKLDKEIYQSGKYTLRATLQENRHDLDSKSTSFYLEVKREPTKKGFIKKVNIYELDEPVRNKPIKSGILEINFKHKDFDNIYREFESTPKILNRQMGYYIIKICLDEAMLELIKMRIKAQENLDLDDVAAELRDVKDKMYYDVYVQ